MRAPDPHHRPPTRRTALAGVLGAVGLVGGCRRRAAQDPTGLALDKPYVPGAEDHATFEEQRHVSACAQCPAACGIRVRVVEGRAVRIEGHPENPLNRGGIGVRGLAGLQALYDPDRISTPLRRVGGQLVAVSWREAIDTLAGALAKLRARAPEHLLVMSGLERGAAHELLERLCRAFGSPNFIDGAHDGTLARAMELVTGVHGAPAYRWGEVGAILSLEAALLEDSCRSIAAARMTGARGDGVRRARLIHAGPAFDLSAYNADRWLRIAPGTSGALALGVCHALVRAGTYDRSIDRARGAAAFLSLVDQYAPARVAAITGVSESAIVELAAMLWDRRPALAIVDERSLAFSNGLATASAVLALDALLGAIETPAGALRLAPTPPLAAWPEVPLDETAHRGLSTAPLGGPAPAPGALLDAICAAPPDVALLYHVNPVYARAQPARWREALAAVPLVVSFSPFRDETIDAVAHLVLPDHTYLERFEPALPAPGEPRAVVGIRRPVVAPLHDTRATADVVLELAHRLGDPVSRAFAWPTARVAFEERLLGLHAAARGTIVEADARAFLDRLYATGFWADAEPAPRAIELALPAAWSPPSWDGDAARYPLSLLAYRPLGYAEGSGANQPWLRGLRVRPGLAAWTIAASISPHDAPGIATGDPIRVSSSSGSLVLPAHVDPRLAPGCVAIPMGGGHQSLGRWARGFGVNVVQLLAGEPACTTRVRIERVS